MSNNLKNLNEFMAKVAWQAGIDYVSGALCKCGKKEPHKHGRMLLATHRRAATTSDSCNRIYLRDESNFVKSSSTNSVWARQRFQGIAALVDARRKDLSRLTQDQMNFIEEKKTRPNFKYTTYKGWLFGKAWKCYDESTNTVTMPERLKNIG